jgi:hypothetical protein
MEQHLNGGASSCALCLLADHASVPRKVVAEQVKHLRNPPLEHLEQINDSFVVSRQLRRVKGEITAEAKLGLPPRSGRGLPDADRHQEVAVTDGFISRPRLDRLRAREAGYPLKLPSQQAHGKEQPMLVAVREITNLCQRLDPRRGVRTLSPHERLDVSDPVDVLTGQSVEPPTFTFVREVISVVADRKLVTPLGHVSSEQDKLVDKMVERRSQVLNDVTDNRRPPEGAIIRKHSVDEERAVLLIERDAVPEGPVREEVIELRCK